MVSVDAHQHFWHPARGDYGWMPMDNEILARPYRPSDLDPARAAHRIDYTVLVQAAPTVHETEYMLGLADATPHIAGVVGWVDFEKPEDRAHLDRLAKHPKFKGVRPMIQDIADDDWMLREDVQWAYGALAELGLTFDALGFPRHLANFHAILTRYPQMKSVVDHCMKPQIRDHSEENFRFWADGLKKIADDTDAFCKLSGIVTETDGNWDIEALRPYADHVLTVFGPDRVMWGSDWPVVRLVCEYDVWREAAEALTRELGPQERARVFGGSAAEFYSLDV